MKMPRLMGLLGIGLAAGPAAAQVYEDRYGMWHGSWGWGHMIVGGLMMILFWAAIIALAVLLIRWLSGTAPLRRRASALDILEERFAKGEIERKEFEEKKRLLSQ